MIVSKWHVRGRLAAMAAVAFSSGCAVYFMIFL